MYLTAVSEHGSITGAAESLHVSQSAVSQALRHLSEDVGVELLERVGRGVVLTPSGQSLVQSSGSILSSLGELDSLSSRFENLSAGTVVVAVLDDLAVDPLVDIIGRFRDKYPGIVVEVASSVDEGTLLDLVLAGRVDLGLTMELAEHPNLSVLSLGVHELFLVSPPHSEIVRSSGSLGGSEEALSFQRIAAVPIVSGPRGTAFRDFLESFFDIANVPMNVAVEMSFMPSALELVLAGVGSVFLPERLATEAASRGCLKIRVRPIMEVEYGIVWRAGDLSRAAEAFVDLLK